jgi:glutathione S-transferase
MACHWNHFADNTCIYTYVHPDRAFNAPSRVFEDVGEVAMAALRIFSYLPNPRIWKATIVARLCGIEIEIRGATPGELADWLWDFDAHPLDEAGKREHERFRRIARTGFKGGVYKTDRFLQEHPFGNVPAAFSPDGKVGIFESNSIMRTVARLGAATTNLYGRDAYEASRIDSFLDATLVFGRDAQTYLLAAREQSVSSAQQLLGRQALEVYLAGIDRALQGGQAFLVGEALSLADIGFAAEFALFSSERNQAAWLLEHGLVPALTAATYRQYAAATRHFERLADHPAFAADVRPYLDALPPLST